MIDFRGLRIEPVPTEIAAQLVSQHHYSRVMPKLTHVCYGGFIGSRLLAIVTLGYGVRPLHTIRKLFPSLGVEDYFEIGKMCLVDELPHNSESWFVSRVIERIRSEYPERKILYTWADGMVGKPGYVYQSMNFLYGGFIWTDAYFTPEGEKIHPRLSKAIMRLNPDENRKARPSMTQLHKAGVFHYRGKQFRYCLPLVRSHREKKLLLTSSTVEWTTRYPKSDSLEWKKQNEDGVWVKSSMPKFTNSNYRFNRVPPVSEATQGLLI